MCCFALWQIFYCWCTNSAISGKLPFNNFWYCQLTLEYTNLKGAFCPNKCIQMCLLRQKYCGFIVEGLTMENALHITFHFIDKSKLIPCSLGELMNVLCYDSIKTESYCCEIYNMYTFCQFIYECLFNHLCRILRRINGPGSGFLFCPVTIIECIQNGIKNMWTLTQDYRLMNKCALLMMKVT